MGRGGIRSCLGTLLFMVSVRLTMLLIFQEIEAQSLEDSSWSRRILQDKGGLCMWEDGKCDLSPRSLLLLLEDSDSPVAQLGKNFLVSVTDNN